MEKVASTKESCIPIGLLKTFKYDLRVHPDIQHANGWMIFDSAMLSEVLKNGTDHERMELAKQLTEFTKAGGNLVITIPQTSQQQVIK